MKFDLHSYVGAGPLRFGMKPGEVALQVGPPELVRTTRSGRRDERRPEFAVLYAPQDNVVDEMEFYEGANVFFKGVDFFHDRDRAFKELLLADGTPFESLGTVVLINLGITCSMPEAENKTITVFAKGKWDPFLPKLKPMPLPDK